MRLFRKRDNARITGKDWNELLEYLRRFDIITGGRGVVVKNLPPGMTISVNPAKVQMKASGGSQVELGRLWTHGPGESPYGMEHPSRPASEEYWVREIDPATMDLKTNGWWESAQNLAERAMPGVDNPEWGSGSAFFFRPIIQRDGDADEDVEIEWDVPTAKHSSGWQSPIVPTWKIPTGDPNVPYKRIFFMWTFRMMQEAFKGYYGWAYGSERTSACGRLTLFFNRPLP